MISRKSPWSSCTAAASKSMRRSAPVRPAQREKPGARYKESCSLSATDSTVGSSLSLHNLPYSTRSYCISHFLLFGYNIGIHSTMPVSRMRMRPWLEARINSNSIAGLVWVDKDQMMFSIPWKHAARHGWEVDKDACLFKQWAIHTGKFKEGVTQPDPKTWKANFRCAMNSLPDIEEVKDKSVNKGCGALRVYRMLPAMPKKKDKRSKNRDNRRRAKAALSKIKVEDMDTDEMQSDKHTYTQMAEERITQENTIDSTENLNTASPTVDIPDISGYEVEIGPDSTNNIYTAKFQVSPMHSTDFEENETDAIIEISRQLERDSSQWLQNNYSGKGFLANEEGTTESYHSPESQWSVSSGEELELRLYTELNPGLPDDPLCTYTEMWDSNTMPVICTL